VALQLPVTLTAIGGHAFFECKNLRCIVLPPALTTLDSTAFKESTINLRMLVVPFTVAAEQYVGFPNRMLSLTRFDGLRKGSIVITFSKITTPPPKKRAKNGIIICYFIGKEFSRSTPVTNFSK
jgi:hypothetical protein